MASKSIVKKESKLEHKQPVSSSTLAKVVKAEENKVETLAQRRILKELMQLAKIKQRELEQLVLEVVDENDIARWRAKWYYDGVEDDPDASPTQKRLAEMLRRRGLDHVEFRLVFPDNYPAHPPLCYNYFPRLHGSYIFSSGGICAETLNAQHGWSCASRAQSLVIAVRAMLESAGCRLQSEDPNCKEHPHDESGARTDDRAIANIHSSGYHGSAGKS